MSSSSQRNIFSRALIWPILIAVTVFLASSRSRVESVGVVPQEDKIAHFAVYGLLATLICRTGRGWRAAAWAIALASAYGLSDEFHQSFVPGRSPDVMDWVADTTGAVLAVLLYAGWARYRNLLEYPVWRRARAAPAASAKLEAPSSNR